VIVQNKRCASQSPARKLEVDRDHAAGCDVAPSGAQAFLGIEKVVEAQRGEGAEHRVGVDEAEADDVEARAGVVLEKGAAIVVDDVGARIVVGAPGPAGGRWRGFGDQSRRR